MPKDARMRRRFVSGMLAILALTWTRPVGAEVRIDDAPRNPLRRASAERVSSSANEAEPPAPRTADGGGSRWGAYLAGAGLAGGIALGILLKAEADDRFDRYLATADPRRARAHFDEAERYDRLSLIGWGVAQISFVALFVVLTRDDARPLIPVEGEPLVRAHAGGMEVGWTCAP